MIVEYGYTSCCETGEHIPLWDFDGIPLTKVEEALREIQEKYKLSTIYILKTRHGYNAICLDKNNYLNIKQIILETKYVDPIYIRLSEKREHMVQRIGEDKHIIKILHSKYNLYQKSNAHRIMLKELYGYVVPFVASEYDKTADIEIVIYERRKKE